MATKKTRIIYWTATIIIFLMEGLLPALTGNSDLAKEGIRHLGYPDYFRVMLNIFKIVGAITLVAPFIGPRIKEWAYAGFGITMISAFISNWAVDGLHAVTFMPLAFLFILVVSYRCYHKLKDIKYQSTTVTVAM
jgi:hypothetical protein